MHPCFGRVEQCLCCNSWEWPAREAAPKLVSTSCSPWIANCQKTNTACKNLQHLSPRPAHLVALKALPQGSHHKSLWDSSVVNLCGDWAESSVMAPSTQEQTRLLMPVKYSLFVKQPILWIVSKCKMKHRSAKYEKLLAFQNRNLTCLSHMQLLRLH